MPKISFFCLVHQHSIRNSDLGRVLVQFDDLKLTDLDLLFVHGCVHHEAFELAAFAWQTGRMDRLPILLFGEDFWRKVLNWQALVDAGTVAERDLGLFRYVRTAAEAIDAIDAWYRARA